MQYAPIRHHRLPRHRYRLLSGLLRVQPPARRDERVNAGEEQRVPAPAHRLLESSADVSDNCNLCGHLGAGLARTKNRRTKGCTQVASGRCNFDFGGSSTWRRRRNRPAKCTQRVTTSIPLAGTSHCCGTRTPSRSPAKNRGAGRPHAAPGYELLAPALEALASPESASGVWRTAEVPPITGELRLPGWLADGAGWVGTEKAGRACRCLGDPHLSALQCRMRVTLQHCCNRSPASGAASAPTSWHMHILITGPLFASSS